MSRSLSAMLAVTLGVTALVPTESEARRKRGPTVNLSVKDADVRQVITFLAREGGLNVVMSEAVTGKVTVFLNRVRLSSALDAVMAVGGLDAIKQGRILVIMTRAEVNRYLDAQRARHRAYPPPPRIL